MTSEPVSNVDWLRDTAMNVMLATEVEEAQRILSHALFLRSAREAEPVGILVPDGEDGLEPLWYEGTNVSEGDELYLHPSPSTEGLGVRVKGLEWRGVIQGRMFADLYMIDRLYMDEWRLFLRANEHGDWPKFLAGPFSLEEAKAAAQADYERRILSALSTSTSAEEVERKSDPQDAIHELYLDALAEAEKAMRKFPQPNYVISKVAEEAGEVVKAAIHCAEGCDTHQNLVGEIRQAMAMLIRLYIEGDQVHGLSSPRAALSPIPDNQEG